MYFTLKCLHPEHNNAIQFNTAIYFNSIVLSEYNKEKKIDDGVCTLLLLLVKV